MLAPTLTCLILCFCVSLLGQMAPSSCVFEGYKTTLFTISQAVCFKSNSWSLWVESQWGMMSSWLQWDNFRLSALGRKGSAAWQPSESTPREMWSEQLLISHQLISVYKELNNKTSIINQGKVWILWKSNFLLSTRFFQRAVPGKHLETFFLSDQLSESISYLACMCLVLGFKRSNSSWLHLRVPI